MFEGLQLFRREREADTSFLEDDPRGPRVETMEARQATEEPRITQRFEERHQEQPPRRLRGFAWSAADRSPETQRALWRGADVRPPPGRSPSSVVRPSDEARSRGRSLRRSQVDRPRLTNGRVIRSARRQTEQRRGTDQPLDRYQARSVAVTMNRSSHVRHKRTSGVSGSFNGSCRACSRAQGLAACRNLAMGPCSDRCLAGCVFREWAQVVARRVGLPSRSS